MTKIFISHSSSDKIFALELAHALRQRGLGTWTMEENIPAGMKWSAAIQDGLHACDAMIVIITPLGMASENVGDEWQNFLDRDKQIFPVRWLPVAVEKMPFQLNRFQYIDFYEKEFSAAFEKLHEALESKTVEVQQELVPERPLVKKPLPPDVSNVLPPPFEWIEIPQGEVNLAMGRLFDSTQLVEVPSFLISKYPITNGQFDAFLNHDNGANNPEWWAYDNSVADWHAKNTPKPTSPLWDMEHPRVDVKWCDATAFCYWLMATASKSRYLITLPTEHQWLRAAVSDTGWAFPWGRWFSPKKCNSYESGRGRTTPVTRFPQGASPFGVMDMIGNVWEWCKTDNYGLDWTTPATSPYRVVRGGSYRNLLFLGEYHTWEGIFKEKPFIGFRVAAFS